MKGFDESWLRDYQKRQVRQAEPPAQPREYVFRLKHPLLLPNRKKNLHWGTVSQLIHELSQEVAQVIGQGPAEPLSKAHITVFRHGIQEPDKDNLTASLKWLLDVLQPRSKKHPYGLGIIAGDDPAHLTHEIFHIQCKTRAEQRTVVNIREVKP